MNPFQHFYSVLNQQPLQGWAFWWRTCAARATSSWCLRQRSCCATRLGVGVDKLGGGEMAYMLIDVNRCLQFFLDLGQRTLTQSNSCNPHISKCESSCEVLESSLRFRWKSGDWQERRTLWGAEWHPNQWRILGAFNSVFCHHKRMVY